MGPNPLVAPERAQLAAFADELALGGGAEAEPEAAGPSLLRSLLAAPEGVARSVTAGRVPPGLEVVAGPGEPLPSQPLPGDVLLRTIEGGAAHAATVASPGLLHLDEASERGLRPESSEPGGYVHTIEAAPVARSSEERFARRVTDSLGNLLTDLVLLRLALPQGTGQPAPTVIVQQPPQADIVAGDDQREAEPERLSPLALPAAPEVVVRSVAAGQPPPEGWRVIAGPSAPLLSSPLEGDVLLQTIEGGAVLAEVVTSGGLLSRDRLVQRGLQPDTAERGSFLHVESADRDHRSARRGYARRATDTGGRLLTDLVLLRALQPPTPGQPASTVVTLPTPGQPAPTTTAQPPRYDMPTPDMPTTDIPVADVPLTDMPAGGMPVTEDEIAFAHIDASRLSWPAASAQQLDLMRRVYLGQVGRSGRTRTFVGDVPRAELAEIEQGFQLRRPAAEACRRLLADARTAAAGDPAAANVSRIGLVSGYRSATQQLAIWNRNFPRYYQETRADRQALDGGEFGSAATELLIGYVSGRLAAPGFSLHNNGLAIDFVTEQGGVSMGADTSARNRSRWRGCWLFRWLSDNANGYGFFQNTAIDEPWHWEFRDPGSTAREIAFTPDTVEPTDAVPAAELTIAAGRAEFSGTPLLASHRGTQPDLILRWNDMADPAAVDVVVHLHGYSADRERMSLRRKEMYSGLDFRNPDDSANPRMGRTSATLCLLPRGSYTGDQPGVNPERYSFPALTGPSSIRDLVAYGLGQFQSTTGAPSGLSVRRTILTAHSGGGEALMAVLAHNSPDEIHVFDALYWDASQLIAWVWRRITSEIAGWRVGKARTDGGLCVLYRGGTVTQSRRLSREINRAIAAAPADAQSILQGAYRVLRTTVEHGDIPRRYGWLLLADVASGLGTAAQRESETEEEGFGEAAPTAPPAAVAGWRLGVDISAHQAMNNAAFANLKAHGKVFVIAKCSQGLQPDNSFENFYRIARENGFIRGSFHFFANKRGDPANPINTGSIAAQVSLVVRQVPALMPGDLAPALDLEDEPRGPHFSPDAHGRFPLDQGWLATETGYHYRAGHLYPDHGAAGRRELLTDIQDFLN